MQNDASRLSINLGRKDEETPANLFIKWTVNTGRIIIVVVELLTLAALGYRFIIDNQIANMHDKINTAKAFVVAQTRSETRDRNLQDRLSAIQSLQDTTAKRIGFLKNLVSYLNTNEFISNNLSVSDNNIVIDGQTYSIFTLNNLVSKIKENNIVSSISIDDLTSLDQGIRFKLTIVLVEPKITL